jgi:hypothetical protein
MVVDIFLSAALGATAIVVAGLLEATDPLAGLVANQLSGVGRRRGDENGGAYQAERTQRGVSLLARIEPRA